VRPGHANAKASAGRAHCDGRDAGKKAQTAYTLARRRRQPAQHLYNIYKRETVFLIPHNGAARGAYLFTCTGRGQFKHIQHVNHTCTAALLNFSAADAQIAWAPGSFE